MGGRRGAERTITPVEPVDARARGGAAEGEAEDADAAAFRTETRGVLSLIASWPS